MVKERWCRDTLLESEAERGGGVRTEFAESGGWGNEAFEGSGVPLPLGICDVAVVGLFGIGGGGGGSKAISWKDDVLSEG
jgi:hypothetical protein